MARSYQLCHETLHEERMITYPEKLQGKEIKPPLLPCQKLARARVYLALATRSNNSRANVLQGLNENYASVCMIILV